jgi:nucleotide-binding universal stress UspA family protein
MTRMSEMKTIMVTTDFSNTSKMAFPYARELAQKYGAKVVVTYVEETRLPPLVIEYATAGVDDIIRRQQERATEQLEQLVEDQLADIDTSIQVIDGTAHVDIVRLANELDIDLIVMATHGRGFITHTILGSTTERVVRRAPCPVLVIREPNKQ